MEKPINPKPEDYGLSQERAKILADPFGSIEFFKGILWVGLIIGLIGIAYVFDTTRSLFLILTGGIFIIGGSVFITMMISAVVMNLIVSPIWLWSQPDCAQFQKFTSATQEYEALMSAWLREQEAWWQALDGRRFEVELGLRLQQQGYVVRRTGGAGDEGVDLVISQAGKTVIVQCKAHKAPIGPGPVRDLYGTLMHKGEKEAWLISSHGFSKGAEQFASGKPIRLLSIRQILQREIF